MNNFETFIKKYPNKYWNWDCLSQNPNISLDFIKQNSNFPWSYIYLSQNQKMNSINVKYFKILSKK